MPIITDHIDVDGKALYDEIVILETLEEELRKKKFQVIFSLFCLVQLIFLV